MGKSKNVSQAERAKIALEEIEEVEKLIKGHKRLLEAIGRLSSTHFRIGTSIDTVIKQLEGLGSRLSVPTREGGVSSIPDAISRVLKKYKIIKEADLLDAVATGKVDLVELSSGEIAKQIKETNTTRSRLLQDKHFRSVCTECGSKNVNLIGNCPTCDDCGSSKCA